MCAGISCHLLCQYKPKEAEDVTLPAKSWQNMSVFIISKYENRTVSVRSSDTEEYFGD